MNGRGQVSGASRTLLSIFIVIAALRLAQEVFVPLALAILVTFLVAPLVEMMVRRHVNRLVAVVVSMTLALTLSAALGSLVFSQFADLARDMPNYQKQLRTNLAHWGGALQGGVADTTKAFEELTREIERVAPTDPKSRGVARVQVVTPPTAFTTVREVMGPVIRPLSTTFAVIVLVTFMLLRLPDLRDRVLRLLGSRNLYLTTAALNDAASRVSRYLLMQILINGWTGLWVAIGLFAIGVPSAVMWGVLTLVLRFIPYVGILMAGAVPLLLSFVVFDDWTRPVMVLGLYGVLEAFNYIVLEPWLYGSRTGVSPVALLLAAGFWAWLWGIAGLFLAVPMTVCAVVMGKYIPQLKFLHLLLGDEPALEPHERLYQRLLGSRPDQADPVLEAALRVTSLLEVCDAVIVPTMLLVEEDYDRGSLTNSKRQAILEHINQWVDERLEGIETSGRVSTVLPPARELAAQLPRSVLPDPPAAHAQGAVLCVPASDRADEIIAKLLVASLLEREIDARLASARDAVDLAAAGTVAAAIVISALPPEAVTPARTACKRIYGRSSNAPIIVGLWKAEGDLERSRARLTTAGASRTVTTFVETFALIEAAQQSGNVADLDLTAVAPHQDEGAGKAIPSTAQSRREERREEQREERREEQREEQQERTDARRTEGAGAFDASDRRRGLKDRRGDIEDRRSDEPGASAETEEAPRRAESTDAG